MACPEAETLGSAYSELQAIEPDLNAFRDCRKACVHKEASQLSASRGGRYLNSMMMWRERPTRSRLDHVHVCPDRTFGRYSWSWLELLCDV